MNRIKTYLNSLGRATRTSILALAVVFVSAGIAQAAATTIGTNITTTGTLAVTGASTLTGDVTANGALNVIGISTFGATASTTISAAGVVSMPSTLSVAGLATLSAGATTTFIRFLSGDILRNATASSSVLTADLTVGSGTSASGDIIVLNNGNAAGTIATSTLTVGCILTTATSSATPVRLRLLAVATTSANGFVTWSYGSSCAD